MGIHNYQSISLNDLIRRKDLRSVIVCFFLSLSHFSNNALFAQAKFIKQIPWAEQGYWLKADTHIHSSFSDGAHSINEIASNAIRYGCDVIAITDHSDRNLKGASFEYEQQISIARRTFPNLIIVSGIEWNIPPYDGDQHVSVLISPGPNEFEILREFKKQFDDYQREEHRAELAIDALKWLRDISEKSESLTVLILNHPSRKLTQTSDLFTMFNDWRGENDLIVGFEGAPGHQKGSPNGSYKGPVATLDGWDPAIAQPGNTWDKLLLAGHDVWGVTSSSDFHATGDDYWPGEFSETWLYSPQRSAEGALAAIKAGSFFGVQGHIVREGTLTVWASGLERSAYPGEVISVPEGEIVLVNLKSKVPEKDFERNTNFLNELTLIYNRDNESTAHTQKQIYISSSNFETSFIVPPNGFTVRGSGKREQTDRRDYLFLTNSIRIEASPKLSDNLLASKILEEYWKWFGVLSLVFICAYLYFRSRKRSGKAKTKPSSHTSSMISPSIPISDSASLPEVDWIPPTSQNKAAYAHSSGRHETETISATDYARDSDSNSSLIVPLIVVFLVWLPTVVVANSSSMHSRFQLSYNILELLEHNPTLVVSLLIAAVACIGFGVSILTEVWMKQPNIAVAAIPVSFTLTMAIGFVFFSSIVPDESLKDILGAPTIASLSPFLELMLRFIATVMGPLAGLILGARLAEGKFRKSDLPTSISVIAMLVVSEMFVIHWTETDNITELLNLNSPIVFRISFLSFFLFCGLAVQQIGTTLTRPNIIKYLRTFLLLAIGIPICWKLILSIFESEVHKYGYIYSGVQFFLSPSREEILSMDTIYLKFVPVYLLFTLLMGVGMSLGICFNDLIQNILSRDFCRPQDLLGRKETPSKSNYYAQHFLIVASVLYFFLIVAGSLVPLDFAPTPFGEAKELYIQVLQKPVDFSQGIDWLTNVILFIPFSFLLMGLFDTQFKARKLFAAMIIVISCLFLSAAIEYSQIWFPPRVVSKNDIIAETVGAGIGVVSWMFLGQSTVKFMQVLTPQSLHKNLIGRALLAYGFFITAYSLLPLDLTIDPSQLRDKLKMGRFELIPFSFLGRPLGYRFFSLVIDFLIYVPLGMLLLKFRDQTQQDRNPIRVIAAISFVIVFVSELIQVFVFSRNVGTSDFFFAVTGAVSGAYLVSPALGSSYAKTLEIPHESWKRVIRGLLFLSIYFGLFIYFFVGHITTKFKVDLILHLSNYWDFFAYQAAHESLHNVLLTVLIHFVVLIPFGFVICDITFQFSHIISLRKLLTGVIILVSFLISFIEVFQGHSKNLTPLFIDAVFLMLGTVFGIMLRSKMNSSRLRLSSLNTRKLQIVSNKTLIQLVFIGMLGLSAFSYRQIRFLHNENTSPSTPLKETLYRIDETAEHIV